MNKGKKLSLVLILILLVFLVVGCGKKEEAPAIIINDNQNNNVVESVVIDPADDGWPEDIPLPANAYDIEVARNASNLNFKIEGNIESSMLLLQEELADYGWGSAITPDSAVGAMATMLRENSNGDTMSVSFQYNQLGEFVAIYFSITRK